LTTTPRYTLGKTERLKSRKLIEQVFKQGKAFSVFPFRIIYLLQEAAGTTPTTNQLQVGFTASTKYFKKAVDRNRIKRLMREGYRLQKNELQQTVTLINKQLSVFFIYTGNELPNYTLVVEKVESVLKRLQKICNEHTQTNS
jgi:ribonuclease P protein component